MSHTSSSPERPVQWHFRNTPLQPSRLEKVVNHFLKISCTVIAFFAFVTFSHMALSACPFRMARVPRAKLVPILYGLILWERLDEIRAAVKKGEFVLGGCVVGPFGAQCPHCHWPCRMIEEVEAVQVVPERYPGLTRHERKELGRVASIHAPSECVIRGVTAVLVTRDDIWLGTLEDGLHRYDRGTKRWSVMYRATGKEKRFIVGHRIKSIRAEGRRIVVESDKKLDSDFNYTWVFFEAYTEDRGRTWQSQ